MYTICLGFVFVSCSDFSSYGSFLALFPVRNKRGREREFLTVAAVMEMEIGLSLAGLTKVMYSQRIKKE